jgi:release factor glutamine methyltransferase
VLDAKLLTGHALSLTTLEMATHEAQAVPDAEAERLAALMAGRMAGESVARIIGEREFYGLPFRLNAGTLEPRPETELLVDLALERLPQGGQVLDLGTGTGCIPIAILANRPGASAVAVDLSPLALAAARENAERNGVAERLLLLQGSWFEPLVRNPHPTSPWEGEGLDRVSSDIWDMPQGGGSKFDLIVSNPPYISSAVVETLAPEVKDFDPRLALDGGPDGLAPYRAIAGEAARYLKLGGQVLLEIGHDQGEAVSGLLKEAGFARIKVHKDLNGLDRVVEAHHLVGSDRTTG